MSEKQDNMIQTGKEDSKQKGETKEVIIDKTKKVSPSLPLVKTKKKESNVSVALTNEELKTLDYADFSTPARMLALGAVLAKSALVPLKTAEDVAVALMTGKELGLPFVTSVSQIYPINGRPTLGVHVQKAILLKNKVIFEKIEDAITIYQFVKTNDEGKVILTSTVKEGKTIQNPIIIGKGLAKDQPKNTAKKIIDTRTTYKFTREIKMPSGKYKEITATGSFSISEAQEADLYDKDVWQKYWRRMLDARAFTNGAREIADDFLLGILAPNELNSNYYINDNGEEVHIATVDQTMD